MQIWALVSPSYTPIDWSLDFISGYRWPESLHHHLVADSVHPGVDIKVPWELARMQHLPQLAWAHALARAGTAGLLDAAAYAREFQDQVLDFLATNPPRYGVNWKCTMDVAIRAAGWLLCRDLFRAHGAAFDPAFEACFLRGVYEHGAYVVEHLEWNPDLRGNHYLANLAGLAFIGAYLAGPAEVDRWLAFALAELAAEVPLQFSPEGSNFEASTSYHRLSAEMVLYATALALALPDDRLHSLAALPPPELRPGPPAPFTLHPLPDAGPVPAGPVPSWFRRLPRMAEFTRALTLPSGRIPQVGDNDNGRFVKLWPAFVDETAPTPVEDFLDHRHLVAAITGLTGGPNRAGSSVEAEVVLSLVDPRKIASLSAIAPPEAAGPPEGPALAAFPDFGLFVYRTARLVLVVRCGPVGQRGNGGHAHNDQLSFELHLGGRPVVVDPGTFVYTPAQQERNRFRSTAFHNTLALDGCEQDPWTEGRLGLFTLRERSRARVIEASPGVFVGEHVGFGPPHRRRLDVADDSVSGEDSCPSPAGKRLLFHLAPGVEAVGPDPERGMILSSGPLRLALAADVGDWSVAPGWYSPGYGTRVQTRTCELRFTADRVRWRLGPIKF
jgi:hypothetical protein